MSSNISIFSPLSSVSDSEDDAFNISAKEVNLNALGNYAKEEEKDIKLEPQDLLITIDNNGSSHWPRKRQRLVMEVVVPTLDEVKHQNLIKKEEDCKIFESFRNPNVQKKDGMDFKMEVFMDRLEVHSIKSYNINLAKDFLDYRVSRKFLSNIYGGGSQVTFPEPAQKFVDKHGIKRYVCLNLQDHQPGAPQHPGAPGLFYDTEPDCIQVYSPLPVFTRVETKPVCLWQFMGLYEPYPSRPLSKEEWAREDSRVRCTWAKSVATKSWGAMARARIIARREPKAQHKVTAEEASEAYTKGEEILQVWTLRCVGYDQNFQNDIRNKFETWVPPTPSPKKDKKRKRSDSVPHIVESEEDETWADSEGEEDAGSTQTYGMYQHKGTRSRPI